MKTIKQGISYLIIFKKIVIVRDNIKTRRDETGIVTLGLINFLMDENSLMA